MHEQNTSSVESKRLHCYAEDWLFLIGLLVLLLGGGALTFASQSASAQSVSSGPPTVENVQAFGKLYGYVQYFHPSDAASEIDWNRFAIHGVQQVKDASDRSELREELGALFESIAPTVQLYPTDAEAPPPADILTPPDTADLNLVAWQHRGLGLGNRGPYRSVRLHRASESSQAPDRSIAQAAQLLDAAPYRGQQVRIQAAVKTKEDDQAHLWLAATRPDQQQSFEELFEQPIASSTWEEHQRTQTVPEDAERLVFGGMVRGGGTAWFDEFELLTRASPEDPWESVELENPSFEAGTDTDSLTGWREVERAGAHIVVDSATVRDGERAALLQWSSPSQVGLFDARPAPGEVVEKPLGRGLSAQIPLALYSENGQTLRPEGAPTPGDLQDALQASESDSLTAMDEALRLGNVVIAWNVFQHFYPYFNVVDVEWDGVLSQTLRRARSDRSNEEFLRTLRRMVVRLEDGHGGVSHSDEPSTTGLPVLVDRIEDQVVVVDTASYVGSGVCPEPGDVVVSVEGTPAEEELENAKQYISGSPQWKTYRALRQFGEGEPGTSARLVLRRDGGKVECQARRADTSEVRSRWAQLQTEPRPDSIATLREGVYYVDLTQVGMSSIRPRLEEFAQAEGVVFDFRGYPEGGNQEILQHLSEDTLRSAHWQIPKIIYPDREKAKYNTSGRWTLPPQQPQIEGEVVFLTDARAISYAESIMGIVEHYELGEIVGHPTAGTNGNVNPFELPGGYRVRWTGMRVVKHDGSQHHLVGIEPTAPAERTLEGVREGRDEVLEKALEVIEGAESSP